MCLALKHYGLNLQIFLSSKLCQQLWQNDICSKEYCITWHLVHSGHSTMSASHISDARIPLQDVYDLADKHT